MIEWRERGEVMQRESAQPPGGLSAEGKIAVAFKDLSRRSTRPRQVLAEKLTVLARDGRSFTADDLWQEARSEDAKIGRATVFRSIEQLVGRELLARIDFPDGKRRYFVCGESYHHHHLACTQCHRITKFDYCLPPEVISAIGTQERFSIEDHSLTLFGRCESCRR